MGIDTLEYCLYLEYFGVLYCSYFECSQYKFSPNRRSILLRSRSLSNTSTVSAPLRHFHPVFWQKTFTDGPTSARWSKFIFSGEQLAYLEYRQYFGSICYASTRSISGYCTADTLYCTLPSTKVFRVRFCGYSGTRSTLTAPTPSTRSIQAFGTAHTHSTHSIRAFSTAHTPSTRSTKYTRYSEYIRITWYTAVAASMRRYY